MPFVAGARGHPAGHGHGRAPPLPRAPPPAPWAPTALRQRRADVIHSRRHPGVVLDARGPPLHLRAAVVGVLLDVRVVALEGHAPAGGAVNVFKPKSQAAALGAYGDGGPDAGLSAQRMGESSAQAPAPLECNRCETRGAVAALLMAHTHTPTHLACSPWPPAPTATPWPRSCPGSHTS
jgi:hypothetical protein